MRNPQFVYRFFGLALLTIMLAGCGEAAVDKSDTFVNHSAQVSTEQIWPTKRDSAYADKPREPGGKSILDSVPIFVTDDYPIEETILDDTRTNYSLHKVQSGDFYSLEQVWFNNDTLNQSLVVVLATDHFQMRLFHFYNNDIPAALIKEIEIFQANGEMASVEQKTKAIGGFVKVSNKISRSQLTTRKGFQLGDDMNKAIAVYGPPHEKTTSDGLEILTWNFMGEWDEVTRETWDGKPVAAHCYAHHIKFLYRNNKLNAIFYYSEIP